MVRVKRYEAHPLIFPNNSGAKAFCDADGMDFSEVWVFLDQFIVEARLAFAFGRLLPKLLPSRLLKFNGRIQQLLKLNLGEVLHLFH